MATGTTLSKFQLTGSWTIDGVMSQIRHLSPFLQQLKFSPIKQVHIDCSKIEAIDMCGLQLLHVLMELLKMNGVVPKIVNPADHMRNCIQIVKGKNTWKLLEDGP